MKHNEKIIGINSLFLIPGKVGGTEIFFRKQVEGFSKLKTKNKFIIYSNNENASIFDNLPNNFFIYKTGINATNRLIRILYEQIILPILLIIHKVDLLHSPGYTTPIFTHCKKITTIFDLNYYFYQEDFSLLQRSVFSILIPLGARFSNKIIVHSNQSKKEMVKVLKLTKNKIEVVYGGVPEDFKKDISSKVAIKVVRKYGIEPPYILANASSHPHKNLKSLFLSFVELSKNKKFEHKLVLLGIHGKAHEGLDEIVKKNSLQERIIFTGWIDHSDTKYFNKAADIFVMPSLYEGFGLPTAEAMACGVPVIASKYSCVPEIADGGALIVDVKKPKEISFAIKKLLKSSRFRKKLTIQGIHRGKTFSWTKMSKKIYNLYNEYL